MAPKPLSSNGTTPSSATTAVATDMPTDVATDMPTDVHGSKVCFHDALTPDTHEQASAATEPLHLRKETEEFVPPDGGWGWLVCFTSFWTNGSIFGIINTFGLIYVALLDEFAESESGQDIAFKTSWIGALQITTTFLVSPFASMLVDRIGLRVTAFCGAVLATVGMFSSSYVYTLEVLYLTYGCLVGIGASLIYTPSMVILGHYFRRHLGLVNGFVAFGSAVFTFALPYMQKMLLNTVGLRYTMQLMSGMLATLMLCVLTWRPLFQTRHTELDHYLASTDSLAQRCAGCCKWLARFCNVSIWRNKGYRIWAIALPIAFLGYFIPFVHLVNHTMIAVPDAQPEVLIMCLGATSGISRLVFGKIADLPGVNRIRMQQLAFLVMGVVTTCIPFAHRFGGLIAIVLVMGICDGCMICLLGPIAFDLLGPKGAAQGLGCLLGLMSFPMTAGPPLAGLVFDHMKSYNIAFWAAGAPPIIGGLILFLVPRPLRQHKMAVTEIETIASMSMENLDKAGTEEDHFYKDKYGVAHVSVWRTPLDDGVTSSVPNLSTCRETGRLVLQKKPLPPPTRNRDDADNRSLV